MLLNLDNYQWSPTFLAFNSDPDQTARSTSWHVYNVCSPSSAPHSILPMLIG
jgi:alpha-N-arabinofuranosidase